MHLCMDFTCSVCYVIIAEDSYSVIVCVMHLRFVIGVRVGRCINAISSVPR